MSLTQFPFLTAALVVPGALARETPSASSKPFSSQSIGGPIAGLAGCLVFRPPFRVSCGPGLLSGRGAHGGYRSYACPVAPERPRLSPKTKRASWERAGGSFLSWRRYRLPPPWDSAARGARRRPTCSYTFAVPLRLSVTNADARADRELPGNTAERAGCGQSLVSQHEPRAGIQLGMTETRRAFRERPAPPRPAALGLLGCAGGRCRS